MDKLLDSANTGLNIIKEDENYEVENQFILRLPSKPAAELKAVVNSGVLNLKDRLTIQIESDMKHGTVRFDSWVLSAKIVDLPCIIESHKTLDKKNFYKTADICQMMVCSEEFEEIKEDKKEDKKDGKDKRFIFQHGITPPLKNVRKKRFRKTLKKKIVDVPEIEKEVKRLFRTDTEAKSVRYEIVEEEKVETGNNKQANETSIGDSSMFNNNSQSMDLEHDLFGEVLSSSDEEDTQAQYSDETSRMSINLAKEEQSYVIEFSKGMLLNQSSINNSIKKVTNETENNTTLIDFQYELNETCNAAAAVASLEEPSTSDNTDQVRPNNENLLNKLNILEIEIEELQVKRRAQELEIADIENFALQQRFQKEINDLKNLETQKRNEYDDIIVKLNS